MIVTSFSNFLCLKGIDRNLQGMVMIHVPKACQREVVDLFILMSGLYVMADSCHRKLLGNSL